jgi:flagellar secretion chaperone FliS
MPPAAQYRASSAYNSVAAHGGVAAADPHKLILMLMDGALERISLARGRIEHKELSEKNRLLSAAVTIVEELRASLDLKAGGSLAANLDDLYDYMARQIINANLQNKVETLDEVSHLLREIRSAWILLPPEARAPRSSGAAAIKE